MALKHYGGRTPEVASTWTCPSCNAENTVPLKAGCQQCGAGGDARKVEALPPVVTNHTVAPQDTAFYAWTMTKPDLHANASETDKLKEAFMAGVAWAQGETAAARIEGRVPPPAVTVEGA